MLFSQLVQSIILTNACIWGHREFTQVNTIQLQAMRFFLGVGVTCPIAGLFGEMGWVPLRAYIRERIIKLWYRLCSMDRSRLTHKIFVWSVSLSERGYMNWPARTSSLISDLQIGCSPSDFDRMNFMNVVWDAIMNAELKIWNTSVDATPKDSESGGKLALYRLIKSEPMAESYVKKAISGVIRRTITQLRCGCLPLEVEVGRFRRPKTPACRRTCQLCKGDSVEDETHFLTTCPVLAPLRIKLYEKVSTSFDPDAYSLDPLSKTITVLKLVAIDADITKITFKYTSTQTPLTPSYP